MLYKKMNKFIGEYCLYIYIGRVIICYCYVDLNIFLKISLNKL